MAAGFTKPYPEFTGTLSQALRPYPQFLNLWSRNSGQGRTWYDSAQFKVERRLGAWLFMASYVRSKTLGLLTYRQIFSQNQVYPQDMYNLDQAKSYLPFDQPNVVTVLNSYELPFGKGKRFLGNAGWLLNALVGNWTISDSHKYASGNLFSLTCPNALGTGVLFTDARMCNANDGPIRTGIDRTSLDPNNPQGYHLIGSYYQEKASKDFRLSPAQKAEMNSKGIAAEDKALQLNPNYIEALVYKNILLRQQANLEKDPNKQKELIQQADDLRGKAMELQKGGVGAAKPAAGAKPTK